jgi:hypothetical protein
MSSTEDIARLLGATLSPDTNSRISAELQLSQTLANPGTRSSDLDASIETSNTNVGYLYNIDAALSLARLVLSQDSEISLRQMSVCMDRSVGMR